jgi:AcrR family transcriptional regulator
MTPQLRPVGAGQTEPKRVPGPPSRQRRRSRQTQRKLLDGARSVFAERGLNVPSIDEITERADVGKGTFYYHFDNKDDLIEQLMSELLGGLQQAMAAECAGVTELPLVLDRLIGAHITFFSNRWEDFVLYFQGRAELVLEEMYAGIEEPFLAYLSDIQELLAGALQARVPESVLRRLACAVAGFVSGYYSLAAIATDDVDKAFAELRGAMVASLTRFVREASASA